MDMEGWRGFDAEGGEGPDRSGSRQSPDPGVFKSYARSPSYLHERLKRLSNIELCVFWQAVPPETSAKISMVECQLSRSLA